MHGEDQNAPRGSKDFTVQSESTPTSPRSQVMSEHQLLPLATPFPEGQLPFRLPMYDAVNARPFSPPGLAPNFLGFQEFVPQGY